ncbi:DegT/DnrJ/EryC1/StrS family aminotransferase [Bacillus salitolerans]|uniref:DegT/DnrJ/EryC1/StrS family aminotransferase n=1 Tax=Bacillus salitolerans TaxID=1437434 RepID=A0ABW4LRS2_9BACI
MSFIPVNEPLLNGNEKKYLLECIDTGWISSEGPFVEKFEEQMSTRVNRKHGVAVSNGTVALELAISSLNLESGDEIIAPTFTIISCVAAIVRNGCVPVLVDCNPTTWNMDLSQIEEKITPKTRAIMIVHIYGLPVDMDPILSLAKKHNLKVIEDAAEMHGQLYKGKPCGSFGDVSIFSFYPNKHITTGEGGMVMTDDDYIANHCRSKRNLCFQPKRRFIHEELGFNYRMTNLQAAIGIAQLEQLDQFVLLKRKLGGLYTQLLSDLPNIQLPLPKTDYAENIYWVFGIVLNNINAETVMEMLHQRGIGTRPFFWPMHKQPVFNKMGLFLDEEYPVSEKISNYGFYLPSGLSITPTQIEIVAENLKAILMEGK